MDVEVQPPVGWGIRLFFERFGGGGQPLLILAAALS